MKLTQIGPSLIALCLIAGCSQKQGYDVPPDAKPGASNVPDERPVDIDATVPKPAGEPNVASPNGQPPKADETEEPKKTSEQVGREKLAAAKEGIVKPPVIVKPGTDGWSASTLTLADFAKRVDTAIGQLTDVAGGFEVELRNGELEGTQNGTFLVSDASIYRVDYVDIAAPTTLRRITANGKSKKILAAKGWGQPVAATTVGAPVDARIVAELPRMFSRIVFESLTERRATWGPMISQLEKQGYQVTLESKNIPTGGVNRPYLRLVASRKGKGANDFEVRLDGIRFVPLTIRMNGTDEKGRPITATWRGAWEFNQKVKEQILNPKAPVTNSSQTP